MQDYKQYGALALAYMGDCVYEPVSYTHLEVLDYGVLEGLIKKSGSWFSYEGAKIGQGRDNAKQFLQDNPEVMEQIELTIRRNLGLLPQEEAGEPQEAPEMPDERE